MDSHFVKGGVRLPNGSWVSRCGDDTAVKALAVRLGVYAQVSAGLRRDVATPGSAALCCDGDALVAIMAWRGFASAKDNGWLALRVVPASEENAGWLEALALAAVGSPTSVRWEPGNKRWSN